MRLLAGGVFAFLIYQVAIHFATGDCTSLQSEVRSRGPSMLLLLFTMATIFAIAGLPAAMIAAMTGVLMGPVSGASLASTALTLGSLVAWKLARMLFKDGTLPKVVEQKLQGPWIDNMMDQKTATGFHWITSNAIASPLPFSYFAAVTGSKVPHLNLQSLIAGIFASSFFYVAAYALAGASIGCAAINHALGFDVSQYRTMVIISCLSLILLARLQSWSLYRSKL
jgi:uncharacterized membrane protein YdjX (TVP38/TMEM64 family)